MSLEELYTNLSSTAISVYYDHAPEGTKLPFATYTVGSNNFDADNKVYKKGFALRLVLYVGTKDTSKEETIETLLDSLEIPWERDEIFIAEETVYQEIYTGEIP